MPEDNNVAPQFDIARIDSQLKKWRERLLDLTRGNPLLGINRSRVSKLRIMSPLPDALFSGLALEAAILKLPLVKRETRRDKDNESTDESSDTEVVYTIEPGDIECDANPKDTGRLLRRIYDNARTTVEERGVTTLHVTFGVIDWDDPILGDSSSPLILVPCQLESRGPNAHLRLSMADEEIQVNTALELYLRERHHVQLPQFAEDPTPDSLSQFLESVQIAVSEQGWTVRNEEWLSTFSFESLVIYNDLAAMAEIAHHNSIVAAFARASSVSEKSETLGEDLDNLDCLNTVPFPVLPADGSQLKAMTIAGAGRHLVIHGPPGTGKSQTITNLIADALGRGQSVLFVSAKMAALDVVYRRLQSLGLGRFCLEAHSTKAGKAKIIEELKRTLGLPVTSTSPALGEQLEELLRTRKRLNDYVTELHCLRAPLGKTLYQAIGAVERLAKLPQVDFDLPWNDVLGVDRALLRDTLEDLENLASFDGVFREKKSHPWRGYAAIPEGLSTPDAVRRGIRNIADSWHRLLDLLEPISGLLAPSNRNSEFSLSDLEGMTAALELASNGERLPDGWCDCGIEELLNLERLCRSGHDKSQSYLAIRSDLAEVTSVGPTELISQLQPLETEFHSWARVMRPAFWRWQSNTRSILSTTAERGLKALLSYLEKARALKQVEQWFSTEGAVLSRYMTDPISNPESLVKVADAFKLTQILRTLLDNGIIRQPRETVAISNETRQAARTMIDVIAADSIKEGKAFSALHWPTGYCDGQTTADAPLTVVLDRCQELNHSMNRMHEWVALDSVIQKCKTRGLDPFMEAIAGFGSAKAPQLFRREFLRHWAEAVLESTPGLREFSGLSREEQIRKFAAIIRSVGGTKLRHIHSVAATPASKVMTANEDFGGASEIGILKRELQKRKRIKPLRKLFAEIPHVLQALKPCMLMSPLSVSTFLKPGSMTFDLVVFDEASQLPTQEAIPSILRAQQVVVAGDENQLPPTSFFLASSIFEQDETEDTEEDTEPLESLLDDCVAVNPVFVESKIAWHYRSKDERLIKFSNHYFYNNSLITFPSASRDSEGRGVRLVYTATGAWDRGRSRTNRVEAHRVAELVIEHFELTPDRTLGVVAMNASQKEAIENALDELIVDSPHLIPLLDPNREESFFVKSLENVQGDERDTILISVGYAKTAAGAISLNFGPLNREGGWRRLNVLVTRAKWQTILVTSLRSQDLGGINPNNKGAYMLRNFIEYAERNAELPAEPTKVLDEETNDFEESVAAVLRDNGFSVDEQVGTSGYRIDLAIRDNRDPNRYLMAIECDGATYHSARTARDRDMLRQEVLSSQGWRVYRLWSTDWFRDREKALQNILQHITLAQQSPSAESVQAQPPKAEIGGGSHFQTDRSDSHTLANQPHSQPLKRFVAGVQYRKCRLPRPNDASQLIHPQYVRQLGHTIVEIVKIEAPIHETLLVDRLKEHYGVSRAGSNIARNVEQALSFAAHNSGIVRANNGFVYKDSAHPEGFRTHSTVPERTLDQIAPEEIENVILYLVEDQFGFAKENIAKAVQDILGIAHVRGEKAEPILVSIERLLDRGELRLNGFTLYLS